MFRRKFLKTLSILTGVIAIGIPQFDESKTIDVTGSGEITEDEFQRIIKLINESPNWRASKI
ncbi:MAG: hypothetical protein KAS32_24625 [Candidatus Peribacteraceae bacterium]|nr:hypothetical protein [Candidatus Peribacteraceae bacterium]